MRSEHLRMYVDQTTRLESCLDSGLPVGDMPHMNLIEP